MTNDHRYREGLLRFVEDVVSAAKWSDVVYVQLEGNHEDAESGIHASIALDNLHNPNGLGHGKPATTKDEKEEIVLISCLGATITRAQKSPTNNTLETLETIFLDAQIDNPSYYSDPEATSPEDDASGYLVTGMTRAIDSGKFVKDQKTPVSTSVVYARKRPSGDWEIRILFDDDGTFIRTGSAGVMVPIVDPAEKQLKGQKEAWLFVTGFYSEATVAVRVAL